MKTFTAPSRRTRVRTTAIAGAAALCLGITACSSSGSSATGPSTSGSSADAATSASYDASLAKLVPAQIRKQGTLTIAANATYPPDEYFDTDNTTIIGFDPDLAHAVGKILGLKISFKNVAFADIIPGLQAGHFDMGWSSATATAERQKVVNFVTYFNAGIGFLVPASSTKNIAGLESLCGLKVAVEAGSSEDKTATDQSAKCTQEGKPAIALQRYQNENQNLLALTSGRAEVSTVGSQIAPYLVEQSHGKLRSVGQNYNVAPLGVEFPKSTPLTMLKAVRGALNKMISDGSYQKILAHWGEQDGAIAQAEILPADGAQ